MDSKTLSNFHRFGKVGRIVITILMVVTIMVTAVCMAAAVYVSTLPREALSVRVTEYAEFRINEEKFHALWGMLANRVSYAGDTVPEGILSGESGAAVPPEGQDFETDLSFFDHAYSSAQIYSDGSTKVVEAKSAPAEYRASLSVHIAPNKISPDRAAAWVAVRTVQFHFRIRRGKNSPFSGKDGLDKSGILIYHTLRLHKRGRWLARKIPYSIFEWANQPKGWDAKL